ncbi:carbohydrate ABC transporter permease [Arhodomonas sp. AD133]|uniref:carbohydrate ABC transporter permease n=1 Tax=Arhodomonas sp. AD133 TaxID=3415009 RepID=UPI003EBD3E2F
MLREAKATDTVGEHTVRSLRFPASLWTLFGGTETASERTARYGMIVLFIGFTIVSVSPIAWLFLSSLKSSAEMFGNTWALPETWRWGNYLSAWKHGVSQYLVSSIIVTTISTVAIVALASAAAFALVALDFRGKTFLYTVILGGAILPPEVSLLPLFQLLNAMGIYDTYWALIIPYVAFGLPFTTFLIRAYMVTIPYDLSEAAQMDGAGALWTYLNIYLPLSRPILASAALISAMRVWNEFIFALTFVESSDVKTITIGMMSFANALRGDWAVMMAGLVIAILPMMITFLVLQRQFIGGLTQGAVK